MNGVLSSKDEVRRWFSHSGVDGPLRTCIGPLPQSRAALGRWTSDLPDPRIHHHCPHPDSYRLVLLMAPLEARVWQGHQAIWGGVIGASRFRICSPQESGSWSRASACDIVNLFIPRQFVEQLADSRRDARSLQLSSTLYTHDKTVTDLIEKMLDADHLAGPLSDQLCDSAMLMLVSYLLEHYATPRVGGSLNEANDESAHTTTDDCGGLRWRCLRKVLQFIDEHLDTLPNNAQLAELCGMSEAHFSREFRRAMGLPPHQYMMRKRLESAREKLLARELRIVDIAHEFGFNDSSHFTRSFYAQFGQTPAQYRQHRFSET